MTVYNPKEIEKQVLEAWEKKKIPEQIVKFSKEKKKFYLLDGPPYVNAEPHVGHVKTTTFKDIWGKFKHMQGYAVWFQPGFDCGGLPIENMVEKKLGLKSKTEIEKIGVDKFIGECNNFAIGNEKTWLDIYRILGAWRGWLKPYLTSENYYIESGWWTVKKIYEKGLLVEGEKPGFWCSHCETVLAGYEVTDSYKNIEDHSIFVKFPLAGKKEFLLVWTTTPWTLPANVAICAHPEEQYVKAEVKKENKKETEVLILAEKRLKLLDELGTKYKILEKFQGKKLEGEKYLPILDIPLQKEIEKNENSHTIIISIPLLKKRVASKIATKKAAEAEEEFGHVVEMETGSGLVHVAPGHGDVDNKLGKHYNLPEPSPVDEKGRLTEETGEFAGKYVKDANFAIIDYLNTKGHMFYPGKVVHSYPLCWRCKTPLIYRMSKQWFLKIDTLKKSMIKENEKVRWLPEFARERFYNILIDAPDWPITRQRYWGIPIPIWVCDKCGARKVIGSVEELKKEALDKIPANMDLHKNSIDKIHIRCECGGKMKRVRDIMDVWFDSSISPWASLGYPFKNKSLFEHLWPVDLIDESQDQVRGWFYYLMFAGFATFEHKPYNTACLNGWTLDEKGEKMSKSLGNVVWADAALKELGSDTLRLYYCYDVSPWDTQKFSLKNAKELQKTLNILWNTYQFIETYSDKKLLKSNITGLFPEDKWLLSRINTLIKKVTEDMENFAFHSVGRSLVDFILNDFSRWYVKLVRDRVSPWYDGKDKKAAQYALVYTLEKLLRLLAPIAPFISDYLYQKLGFVSVHISSWPKTEEKVINTKLEEEMEKVKILTEAMNSMRQEENIKLRWPLAAVYIQAKDKTTASAVKNLRNVIQNIGNVKKITTTLPEKGKTKIKIKEFEGFKLGLGKVLKEEAFIREVIRQIQVMRKEHRLHVKELITLWLHTDEKTKALLMKRTNELKSEVGAKTIHFTSKNIKGKIELEGKTIEVGFEKAEK